MRLFSLWSHRLDQEEADQWVAVVEVPDEATPAQEARMRARSLLAAYLTQEDLNTKEQDDPIWYQFYTNERIPPDYEESEHVVLHTDLG